MNNVSHTLGPWSNERIWDTPTTRIHARVEGVPMALAEVFTMRNVGEKEANARLIAMAPDMLAALRKAEEALRSCYQVADYPADGLTSQDRALGEVRDAIAKATGGSDV